MNNKLKVGDKVLHKKTGRVYIILEEPQPHLLLEADAQPFYKYTKVDPDSRAHDLVIWVRCKSEMEDGRFEVVE